MKMNACWFGKMNDVDSGQDTGMHMDGFGGSRRLPTSVHAHRTSQDQPWVDQDEGHHTELAHMGTPESGWGRLKNRRKELYQKGYWAPSTTQPCTE